MTRLITFIAIATLAAVVLFPALRDHRMAICVTVSVAAGVLILRSFFTGRIVIAGLFVVVLGVFTPFRDSSFSHTLISMFDLATLALFAASPMILRKPQVPAVAIPMQARL